MMTQRASMARGLNNPPENLPALLSQAFAKNTWSGKNISLFYPMGSEISPLGLLPFFKESGARFCLPVVIKKNTPLIFRSYDVGDKLVSEAFGTSSPSADKPEVIPDIMIVPLLAFDKEKFRLGYGGGFYDRTIEKISTEKKIKNDILTIGLAWDGQKIDKVPIGPFDKSLNFILTEKQIYS